MTTLIVTSPHALCPNKTTNRMCDLAAGVSADIFCNIAKLFKALSCLNIKGNEYRHNHDLNRNPSRNTLFRQKLTGIFQSYKNDTIIIDMHSFPDYWDPAAGDINFFKKDEKAPDIAILQGKLDNYKGISLSKTLFATLTRSGINTKLITGIKVNDIMNNAAENDIPGVLIEVNEKYNHNTEELAQICDIILTALNTIANL